MSLKNTGLKYGSVAVMLHWLTVLAVFGLFATGGLMAGSPDQLSSSILRVHAPIGGLTAVLVFLRIIWMIVDRNPNPPENLSPLRLLVFKAIHFLTYLALLGMAFSGVGIWFAEGFGLAPEPTVAKEAVLDLPPLLAHRVISKLLAALLVLHIGGVLSYQFLKSDVLHRMGIPWFKGKSR